MLSPVSQPGVKFQMRNEDDDDDEDSILPGTRGHQECAGGNPNAWGTPPQPLCAALPLLVLLFHQVSPRETLPTWEFSILSRLKNKN